jgi:PAS domain S-box-containing protein
MKNAYPETKNSRFNRSREHDTADKDILNLTSSKNNGFFHLLAENARDLIFHAKASPTYRFDYVSPSSTRITGYTPEEFYADPLLARKCILEEDYHLVSDPSKWSDPHNNKPVEIRWRHKNGNIIWTEHMISTTLDKDGKPESFNIIARDITERKQAEAALLESQQFNASLLENAPHATVVINPDTSVKYVNPAWERLNGWTLSEITGIKVPYPWWPPQFRDAFSAGFIEAMRQGSGKSEIVSQKKNGELYWIDMNWASVTSNGELLYLLINSVDITDRKRMEDDLRESEEKFSRAFHASPNSISINRLDDGKFIDVNDTFLRDKGYSRKDIIGRTSREINIWVDFKERAKIMNTLKKQGHIHNEEVQYRTKSGQVRTGLLSAEIINIGSEPCVLMINTDITRQRLAEKQLRLLGLVTQQVSDATVITDPHFNITYMNKAAQDLFGYNINELKGKNLAILNKTQPSAEIKKSIRKTLDNGGVYNATVAKKRKDGTTIICDCRLSPLYDEHGNITSIIDVQRDITKQQEVEAKLQEHKKLIESILATTPEGVLVINNKNRILLANKALREIFHFHKKSLENKLFTEIFPLKQFYDLHKAKKRINTEKNTLEFRYQVQNTENIIYCVIVKMDKERTLLTFSDVSREREEEEKLYLADRLASIGEMAAGLAHELNNPLTGILALTQLLTSGNLPDDYKDDLECINTEAKRAASIVKNVLLFARSKTDENGHSSVNDVFKDVLRLREYEERTSNITIVMNLQENLPDIPIDKGQLQQVFLNLFSNAEAAIKQANRQGTITVTTQRINNHVNITFTDNGCGIKKQVINRVFDPFFTTKEIGKGTGLGLSICYSIIVKHGGKINVKSQINKGTTFTIKMPIIT